MPSPDPRHKTGGKPFYRTQEVNKQEGAQPGGARVSRCLDGLRDAQQRGLAYRDRGRAGADLAPRTNAILPPCTLSSPACSVLKRLSCALVQVLELCCGTSDLSPGIAEELPDVKVLSTDFSEVPWPRPLYKKGSISRKNHTASHCRTDANLSLLLVRPACCYS